MNASLPSLLAWMLMVAVVVASGIGSRAADLPPEPPDLTTVTPVAFQGELVLEPLGGQTESLPPPPAAISPTPSPTLVPDPVGMSPASIVDVAASPLDGMLIDEGFDEMPFEASSGRWFSSGGWYAGGESLWMDRSINNRRDVGVDAALPDVTYTTFSQPFNVAPGARATIGKSLGRDYLDRDRAIEFIYYGGLSYDDVASWNAVGTDSLFTPMNFNAPGFNAAGTFATSFNSDFNSWEWSFKLRRRLGRDKLIMSPNGSWTKHAERGWLPALIIGPRLANVNEQFSFVSSRPGTPSSDFGGVYNIDTENWLLGLNVGGELISQNEFYYWGLRGRAAPALTFASTSQAAAGVNTTGIGPNVPQFFSFTDAETKTAAGFIGDLTLFAGWQITPNFAFQVGYDFLWVAGMATATRQFNLDDRDNDAIDTGGQTFYNGVSFGFNGSW